MTKPTVEIWDSGDQWADRYTVLIGRDVYGMGSDPTSPAGLNQYSHTLQPGEVCQLPEGSCEVPLAQLPQEVQRAITDRLAAYE